MCIVCATMCVVLCVGSLCVAYRKETEMPERDAPQAMHLGLKSSSPRGGSEKGDPKEMVTFY